MRLLSEAGAPRANLETYRRLSEDMDVDAGRILEGRGTLGEVRVEIFERIQKVAAGEPTKSEALRPPGVHSRRQVVRAAGAELPARVMPEWAEL